MNSRMFVRQQENELKLPGEYGRPEKPDGWVVIHVPELSNQTIYLTSQNFSKKLSAHCQIPSQNIVSLIGPAPHSKHGIPEEILSGPIGLEMFAERLKKITDSQSPILIHCKQGLNRTPVAAVLYLISRHIRPEKTVEMITSAYREQRDENFVLDKRGHYTLVLQLAGVVPRSIKRGHGR